MSHPKWATVRLECAVKWDEIQAVCADIESPLRCVDASIQDKMKAEVDTALKAGDTVRRRVRNCGHNVAR